MTGEILLQIVMAMIGALGFGLLFHISGSRLITIMLGAAVNWGVYLLAMQWYDNRVTAFFVSTLATAALAELLARLLKAPVITLLVPMLVPLIPGGDLYYTTLALVQGDTAGFARYGTLFIEEAGAMAFGVILVACLVQTLGKLWMLYSERKERKRSVRGCRETAVLPTRGTDRGPFLSRPKVPIQKLSPSRSIKNRTPSLRGFLAALRGTCPRIFGICMANSIETRATAR